MMSHDDMMGCVRTDAFGNPASTSIGAKPNPDWVNHSRRFDRIVVWFKNLWHWRTAWAVRYLSKQLQKDKAFRDAWQANIATTIYNSTRGHHPTMSKIKGGGVAVYVRHMPLEQVNYIADRLMKHLFNA